MIKVKAKRTIFNVYVDEQIKTLTYDSQKKPTNRELLVFASSIIGVYDNMRLVSRETHTIILSMPFETFYEFSYVEYSNN